MADLKGQQIKDRYQSLLTLDTITANPTTGTLQNGDGSNVTQLTIEGDIVVAEQIIHSGDMNTAIRFPANDTFSVVTAGVERLRVTSAGKVGIGTDNPGQKLTVNSGASNETASFQSTGGVADIYLKDSGTTNGQVRLRSQSNTFQVLTNTAERTRIDSLGLMQHQGGAVFNESGGDNDFRVEGDTDANLLFVDASADKIGIGKNDPATALDVNGDVTITDKIIHSGDTNTAIRFPANDTVTVETGGSERMRITSAGNVGIGTTSPGALLHVQTETSAEIARFRSMGANSVADMVLVNDAQTWGFRVDGGNSDSFFIRDFQSSNNRLTITTSGNVGIGTTSPGEKLDVDGFTGIGPSSSRILKKYYIIGTIAGSGTADIVILPVSTNKIARVQIYVNGQNGTGPVESCFLKADGLFCWAGGTLNRTGIGNVVRNNTRGLDDFVTSTSFNISPLNTSNQAVIRVTNELVTSIADITMFVEIFISNRTP